MKTLTIITTTYNRAYCIGQVYESLKRQDCKDFCWLVIDDGSTDKTREVIECFKSEGLVEIEYIYQSNKGMTGARNTAYNACHTELNTIIDSDDWLADGAVGRIIDFWNDNKGDDIAGIIAYNVNPAGKIIGDAFPNGLFKTSYMEIFGELKLSGDKKLIYRSDISRLFPYPEIEGEKFFAPSYKFYLIDNTHKLLAFHQPICVVDYNDDSMSFDKIAQYRRCPIGFSKFYNLCLSIYNTPKDVIKYGLMYIAMCKIYNNKNIIKESSRPFIIRLLYPFGTLLSLYICNTKRKALSVPKKH